MMRVTICMVLLVLFAAGTLGADEGVTLVRDGRPAAVIVIPSDRDWKTQSWLVQVEQQSSRCLQAHFLQMSGAAVPIVGARQLGDTRVEAGRVIPGSADFGSTETFILLGDMPLTRALGVTADDLTVGGFRIRTFANAVVLLGHPAMSHPIADGGGLRAAVVHVLEGLGCRYLWPGESGKVVPLRKTIALAAMDRRICPVIQQRNIRWMSVTPRTEEGLRELELDPAAYKQTLAQAMRTRASELVEPARYQSSADFGWLQWHGLGGDIGLAGGHAFGEAWNKWGKDHPDWFALQADGTRDQSKAGGRARLCVSNLGLIQAVADEIIEEARRNPAKTTYSLSPNDGGYSSFCTCPNCEALDPKEAPVIDLLIFEKVGGGKRHSIKHASLTDRYVWFWNQIAQRVTAVHPNLLMTIDAYSAYSTAPVREKLHSSLVLRYVPSGVEDWDLWRQAGATRMYWRPNILHRATKKGELTVYARWLAETMQRLTRDGMLAVDMDSITGSWAVVGLNYYTAARMSWDPGQTYDQLLDDFCRAGFGSAAEPVRRYFVQAEQCSERHGNYQTPVEELVKLRALLRQADTLAGGDEAVLERIAMLRHGLNYTEVRQRLDELQAAAAAKQPFDLALGNRLLDLHYLMLREMALYHPLAIDAGLITRYAAGFRDWPDLGSPKRRPSAKLVAAAAAAQRLTGRENTMDTLFAAFGLDGSELPQTGVAPAKSPATIFEADETGGVRELPAP